MNILLVGLNSAVSQQIVGKASGAPLNNMYTEAAVVSYWGVFLSACRNVLRVYMYHLQGIKIDHFQAKGSMFLLSRPESCLRSQLLFNAKIMVKLERRARKILTYGVFCC